jgi:2-dehydropantoate 2-reductase
MRIALVGVGSLGTIIGALLAKADEDITLVDANFEHVQALNEKGATITGHMDIQVPVKAVTPDKMQGPYDLVIYLVKSTYDDDALPALLPHLNHESVVLTLQNGIPEDKVASIVGGERTVGGAVGWAGIFRGPGTSELASQPEVMTYDIGELDGSASERIKEIKAVLDKAGKTEITSNLTGIRWSKLLVNVSLSGMSTILGCNGAAILDDEKALRAAVTIMVETLKTAAALGIKVEPMQGVDPNLLFEVIRQGEENAFAVMRMIGQPHREGKASMLQDLEKGRRCEVEAINGYLERKAREAGVDTPVNDKVTAIIRDIQEGKAKPRFENLDFIEVRPLQEII